MTKVSKYFRVLNAFPKFRHFRPNKLCRLFVPYLECSSIWRLYQKKRVFKICYLFVWKARTLARSYVKTGSKSRHLAVHLIVWNWCRLWEKKINKISSWGSLDFGDRSIETLVNKYQLHEQFTFQTCRWLRINHKTAFIVLMANQNYRNPKKHYLTLAKSTLNGRLRV